MKRVFRLPGTRRRADEELDAELRFHLEGRIEELMEREHLTREAAELEAKRRFGDYDAYRREARTIDDGILQRRRKMDVIETLKRETRHAARTQTADFCERGCRSAASEDGCAHHKSLGAGHPAAVYR